MPKKVTWFPQHPIRPVPDFDQANAVALEYATRARDETWQDERFPLEFAPLFVDARVEPSGVLDESPDQSALRAYVMVNPLGAKNPFRLLAYVPNCPYCWRRFVWAHELGHLIVGGRATKDKGDILFRREYFCDLYAGHLLLPPLAHQKIHCATSAALPAVVRQVANHYGCPARIVNWFIRKQGNFADWTKLPFIRDPQRSLF